MRTEPNMYVRRMRPLLGTFVEIGVRPSGDAHHSITAAFAEMERVQQTLSFQDPNSELSRLNQAAGAAVELSPLALRVLRLAHTMTRASEGLFNCTVGGALVRCGALPDHGGVAFATGDASDLEIGVRHARLRRPVRITLDGIAKGYAVDLGIRTLKRRGGTAGWINAGGDMRAFGDCTVPVVWRAAGAARAGLNNAALATSAGAASDPSFPAVIIDSETSNLGCRHAKGMWSVLAQSAWRADALTKVAALAGDAQRASRVERLGGRLIFASAA